MLFSTGFTPILAEIDPGQVFLVIVLIVSAIKSALDSKKKDAAPKRPKRRPTRLPQHEELPFPVFVEQEPQPELQPRPSVQQAQAGAPVAEGREVREPLGLDLQRVEAALPSRKEESFESHRREAFTPEGGSQLAPMLERSSSQLPTRPQHSFMNRADLRRAIVMAEVLSSPVALRKDSLACHPR